MGSISRDYTSNFSFASIYTKEDTRTGKTMVFTSEAEDEVIWKAVSYKLDITLVNTSNKVWRDSTQTKSSTSPFYIGNYVRYKN